MVSSQLNSLLTSWSQQGDISASARTYASIRSAIEADDVFSDRSVDVYLQGSYANSTNIRGDSDVDVVVQSSQTFFYRYDEQLSAWDREVISRSISPAWYDYETFRGDVLRVLQKAFSQRVHEGAKALKIDATQGFVNADVVPAFNHKLYVSTQSHVAGMAFRDRRDEMYVNYPKQHQANGEAKNGRCGGNFKATVRILKNLRNALYDAGALRDDSAPSYYVECLVANASDAKFHSHDLRQRIDDVLADLLVILILHGQGIGMPMCLNGVIPLFGDGNTQWNARDARSFVDAARAWMAQA